MDPQALALSPYPQSLQPVNATAHLIESYIHKVTQLILESRQIFSADTKTEGNDDFQLHCSQYTPLKQRVFDKYLQNWTPSQSSLTFTIDISLQIIPHHTTTGNISDDDHNPQLIEQWKIVFNHGITESPTTPRTEPPDHALGPPLDVQMALQLRSLMSYLQCLPIRRILPPSDLVDAMDLFNLSLYPLNIIHFRS